MLTRIDSCGTPDSAFSNELKREATFVRRFLLVKYSCIKFNEAKSKTYACNLAINKSWRSKSNASDMPVNNALIVLLLLVAYFQILSTDKQY